MIHFNGAFLHIAGGFTKGYGSECLSIGERI